MDDRDALDARLVDLLGRIGITSLLARPQLHVVAVNPTSGVPFVEVAYRGDECVAKAPARHVATIRQRPQLHLVINAAKVPLESRDE